MDNIINVQHKYTVANCQQCNKKHVLLFPSQDNPLFCSRRCEKAHDTQSNVQVTPPTASPVQSAVPDNHFLITPRDYQQVGIDTMRQYGRIMNADSVGLGKTVQAAFAALETPVLIMCPAYLVSHWRDWYVKNTTGFIISACEGGYWLKLAQFEEPTATHVIISYESLDNFTLRTTILEHAKRKRFKSIIYDECHHLRNHKSQRALFARRICAPDNCINFFPLTGTPIWKEVDDLYHQFQMLHPDLFPSYNRFVETYCLYDDGYFGRTVLGVKPNMVKPLEELLALMAVRRDYTAAGRELPHIISNTHAVKFPSDLQNIYDEAIEKWSFVLDDASYDYDEQENVIWKEPQLIEHTSFMSVIHLLRQLTAFPGKIEVAENIINDSAHDTRCMVFTWYKETADRAYRYIKENGHNVTLLNGDIPASERRSLAMDTNNRVIVATIGSLSEGVDLSDIRTVIFLEEHWAFGSLEQCLGRIRRDRGAIDQPDNEPIRVHYVHVSNSIDTHIHAVQTMREGTAKAVLKATLGK